MAHLLVEEAGKTQVFDLARAKRLTVRRGRRRSIVLADASASRQHCRFEREGESVWLEDLGSRNGTRVNGRPVTARTLLRPGDTIAIGECRVTFGEGSAPGSGGARANPLERDADTGLLSFAAVRATLARLLEDSQAPLAVLKIDVDALGLLNSVLGYEAGDAVLGSVARATAVAVGASVPGASLGRESGGKLVVVLPGLDARRAGEVAAAIRARVVAELARDPGLPPVTLSVGAAAATAPRSTRRLLLMAEAALAEAKRTGRDRVVVAPEGGWREPPWTDSTETSPPTSELSGVWDQPSDQPHESDGPPSGVLEPDSIVESDSRSHAARRSTSSPEAPSRPAAKAPSGLEPLFVGPAGQRALALASQALGSDLDLDGLAEFALSIVLGETAATRGLLVLRDERGELRLGAAVAPRSPSRATAPASHGVIRAALARPEGILALDVERDSEFAKNESVVASGARSFVAAPILWGDVALGAIYLESDEAPGKLDRAALDLVRAFARLLGGPIRRGLLHRGAQEELSRARLALQGTLEEDARLMARYRGLVGRSTAAKKLLRLIDRFADRPLPVIVTGESGTGKELVARALHQRSRRASGPFVAENCAALTDQLLEAELFGYRKGAFSGADRDHTGLLEAADKGTLFLDEVGDMSATLQAKLLRFLQEGELRPLGDDRVRRVSVRVVAATHRDLRAMVRDGQFREDLFYRLAVLEVKVPPLRERRDDVPLLVEHFLERAARERRRSLPRIEPETLAALVAHDWPGNIRQLENELRRLVALGQDPIRPEHLSTDVQGPVGAARSQTLDRAKTVRAAARVLLEAGGELSVILEALEREVLGAILADTKGNRSQTARRLGLTRTGLRMKMKRLGIDESGRAADEEPYGKGREGEDGPRIDAE